MKTRSIRLGFTILALTLWSVFSAAQGSPQVEKATRHLANGQFDEVILELQPWIDENPDVAAHYILGYALYEKGRHKEAIEMFEAGYFLDPNFSPSSIEGLPWIAEMEARTRSAPKASRAPRRAESERAIPNMVIPVSPPQESAYSTPPPEEIVEVKHVEPVPPVEPAVQEPVVIEPAPPAQPEQVRPEDLQNMTPQQMQQFLSDDAKVQTMMAQATQGMESEMPLGLNPNQIMGFMQTFGVLLQILSVVQWIFTSLCLFLVARKVGVEGPWLAFIPIVQIYTFVRTAGKPWWWLLLPLLFIPASFLAMLGPIFILVILALALAYGAALCMGIAENAGRNKWAGLLLMIPIVQLVYWGILAFSKTESAPEYDETYFSPEEDEVPGPMA